MPVVKLMPQRQEKAELKFQQKEMKIKKKNLKSNGQLMLWRLILLRKLKWNLQRTQKVKTLYIQILLSPEKEWVKFSKKLLMLSWIGLLLRRKFIGQNAKLKEDNCKIKV